MTLEPASRERLRSALEHASPSARMQAALTAGSRPDRAYADVLIDRCALEPDFSVRETLTWAITRLPADDTVPRLLTAASSGDRQARTQALHTLSKFGDPRGWAAITPDLIAAADDDLARAAWRAAVALVPAGGESELARVLCGQLGREPREVRLSLSRALAALGEEATAALAEVLDDPADAAASPERRAHALATLALIEDPSEAFDAAIAEARRVVALHNAPVSPPDLDVARDDVAGDDVADDGDGAGSRADADR